MPKFNENHIRYYSATMHIVEDKMQEISQLLNTDDALSEFTGTRIINDLTTEDTEKVLCLLQEMRNRLKEFSMDNEILAQPRSMKEIISVKAAFLWEALAVTTFDHLTSYGMVDENRRRSFERHIRAMITLAEKLMIY